MRKTLAASLALGLAMVGLTGLVSSPAANAAGKTLTYGVVLDITDWQASSGQQGNLAPFYQAVYDRLAFAKADGTLMPGLAKSWAYDKTKTVLTLNLRTGVKFTNGEVFNAAAVVKSLKAFQTGASPNASQAAGIKSVVAKGASVVVITLNEMDPAFESYLSNAMGLMGAPRTIGAADAKTNPVGTGPYILDKANSVSGSTYNFKPNPTYWNKANRPFDNLVIKVISDRAAAVNAIKAGQVDCIALNDNSAVPTLTAAGLKVASQQLNWVGLTFVDKSGRMGTPLKNVKVRQAINYAFDREVALKIMGGGYGVPTQQVFATYNRGYVKALDNAYPYNVSKAKALLAEAGYPNGFAITMPSLGSLSPAVWQYIKESMGAIGITVNYSDVPPAEYINQLIAPKFALYRMNLERNQDDWTMIRFLIGRDAPWNPSGYGDSKSDALLAKIQVTSGAAQTKLLQQLNTYISQQAWFAPLYAPPVNFVYNSTLNVKVHGGNAVPFLSDISPK